MKRDSPATARLKRAEKTARAAAIIRRDPDIHAGALAAELGVSQSVAYKYRLAVEQLYERRAVAAREHQIGRQLMAYHRVIEQAEEGILKNLEAATEHTVSEEAPANGGGASIRKTVKKSSGRFDGALLRVKMDAFARIDKLLGLEAPTRVQTSVTLEASVMPELAGLVVRILSEVGAPPEAIGRFVSGAKTIIMRLSGGAVDAAARAAIGDDGAADADEYADDEGEGE